MQLDARAWVAIGVILVFVGTQNVWARTGCHSRIANPLTRLTVAGVAVLAILWNSPSRVSSYLLVDCCITATIVTVAVTVLITIITGGEFTFGRKRTIQSLKAEPGHLRLLVMAVALLFGIMVGMMRWLRETLPGA